MTMKIDPRLVTDPAYFFEKVLELKLTPYQKEWIQLLQKHKRMSLMAFRSSGKTELFFVCYPIWRAFIQSKFQGLVVSNTENQAKEILKRIKQKIEGHPLLRMSIPSTRADTWSKTEITLSNGSWIGSKTYNENLRSYHVDFVGLDEVGMYRDHSILKEVVIPTVRAKNGNIICVGTPTSDIDLLHSIEQDREFRAFYTGRYPAEGEKGDLFLIRYPNAQIQKKHNLVEVYLNGELSDVFSTLTWSQEYLLNPLGTDDQLFPYTLIVKSFDNDHCMRMTPKTDHKYYFGLDFALSGESSGDYTVITVIERKPDSQELRVVNIERRKGLNYQLQKQLIYTMYSLFKPIKLLCDDGNIGKTFIQDLRQMYLPVEGYHFGGNSSVLGQNKRELFMALREQFEKEQLKINCSDKDLKTRSTVNYLVDELTKFGIKINPITKSTQFESLGKHDDMVDSLALAVFAARGFSTASFAIGRSSNNVRNSLISVG